MSKRVRTLAGPSFGFAGAIHFIAPRAHRPIVPRWICAPGAIFPANLQMPLHPERYPEMQSRPARTALWARLPLQAVFIAWGLGAAQEKERRA